jgi:hypothetical protein
MSSETSTLLVLCAAFLIGGTLFIWLANRQRKSAPTVQPSEADVAIERWKGEADAHCAPLFILDFFLHGGHDASTRNATATFVTFGGKYYACTCRHAVELVQLLREKKAAPNPTLALFFDKTMIPLSFFTAEGLKDAISIVAGDGEEDLAIADITQFWPRLAAIGKVAIEMDEERHRAPRWAKAQMLAAVGFPERNKRNVTREDGQERVFGTMTLILSDKSGDVDRHNLVVEMKSTFEEPHGWYFSGISGGPMYVIQDERLIPVGIAFEGWPQSPTQKPHPTLTDKDIVVRGLTLTPENFKRWLIAARLSA